MLPHPPSLAGQAIDQAGRGGEPLGPREQPGGRFLFLDNAIVYYRLYDVADVVDLEAAEARLGRLGGAARVRLEKVGAKSMSYQNPPLAVDAGTAAIEVNGEPVQMSLRAKVYDLGVISVVGALRMDADASQDDWLRVLTLTDPVRLEVVFTERMDSILAACGSAAKVHDLPRFVEDFTVLYFGAWDPSWDPVPLLLKERGPVSAQTRQDVLAHSFSYGPRDLAIITWDTALVYDADGGTDLLDLLELANTQLLELRYYDALLGEAAAKAHAEIHRAATKTSLRRLRHYREIMKGLMENTVEVTEIVEKVRNTLKVTEDVFYARVYGAALDIFRAGTWMDSINRKLDLLQRSYSMLSDEIITERDSLLEASILFLIVLELIVALLPYVLK